MPCSQHHNQGLKVDRKPSSFCSNDKKRSGQYVFTKIEDFKKPYRIARGILQIYILRQGICNMSTYHCSRTPG